MISIYFGDDEYALEQAIQSEKAGLGDDSTIALNFSILDGRSTSLDELRKMAFSIPFLAQQRIVVLSSALSLPKNEAERSALLEVLEQIPASTKLILSILDENKYDPKTKSTEWQTLKPTHWLMKWAAAQSKEKATMRSFTLPRGKALVERLRKQSGDQISQAAAERLIELIGDEPFTLKQETEKLLAYVNYQRTIEEKDVFELTAPQREENIFEFVDALGNRNIHQAAKQLTRLLEQQEPYEVFAMVIRQFRILIQARALLDEGATKQDLAEQISDLQKRLFIAEKIIKQAARFSLEDLKAIYHHLCEIDENVKTGKNTLETALFSLIAAIAS